MNEADSPSPAPPPPPPAPVPLDSASQALEEALRSSFFIVKIIMVILVGVFLLSGMRTVGPEERALKFRFGKPMGVGEEQLLGPGFHWAFPYPIDEVKRFPVGQIQSVTSTVGWYATTPEQELAGTEPPPGPSLNPAADGYALTADGNIVHVRVILRYRIADPLAYGFQFVNASNTVLETLNNALLHTTARMTVDDALLNLAAFREKLVARVTQQVDALKLGITLEPVDVRIIPPRYIKSAFDDVLAAEAERSRSVLNARGAAEAALSEAAAEATARTNAAQAARTREVAAVQAFARSFAEQLPQYRADPELFHQRKLIQTWQNILTRSGDKFYLPARTDGQPQEVRLQLNREPRSPKPPETK